MTTSAVSATDPNSQVNVQQFLKILTTELTNQDPLQPTNNEQFVAQLAQFTTLEQTQELNQKIDSLLQTESAVQSVGLLGKTVTYSDDSGSQTGQVVALALASGVPSLTVQTSSGSQVPNISLSQVTGIK